MTNIWTPNGNRVAALAPGPGDLFVVTTMFGKRVFVQPIGNYDRAVKIAEAFARQMTQERPFTIKVLPMSFSELLARLHALQRRGKQQEPDVLKVADLEVQLLRRRVERAGQRIDLTAKEYGLLLLLMRRAGQVQSRTVIAEQVWDMNFDSDSNVVDVQVRRLRLAMDDAYDKKLIHTVVGVGYVLEDRSD